MSSLLYPGRRLLLAVAPEQAPEAVKLIGMLLYIAAPAGLVAAAMALTFAPRSVRERIHRPLLWILGTAAAGLLLYSIRYGISAYHRESLLVLNNLAVHAFYLVLFAFNLSLIRLWDRLPERFVRPYFRYLQAAGLYIYLVGYTAFLVTTVNVFARLIELGFLLVILPALSQLLLGLRMPHGLPSMQDGLREGYRAPKGADSARRFGVRLAVLSLVFLAASGVAITLRFADLSPDWLDTALLFPVYVIVISVDTVGYLRRRSADLRAGGMRPGPAPSGSVPQDRGRRLEDPGPMPRRDDRRSRPAFFERAVADFGITARERAVLELVMQGKNNAAVAEALGISEKTVRNHISNLYYKTDTANRVELVQTFEVVV
jgi:DNA-binding CsgD family transcriptional regulator